MLMRELKSTSYDYIIDLHHNARTLRLKTVSYTHLDVYKRQGVYHLTKIPSFSRLNLPIGGGKNIINAARDNHGPSWRMVVSLTQETQAYGIYPGGQSGNPGSKYYDTFISDWAEGKYYTLWMMKKAEEKDSRVKWTMHFEKS